ncbi:MAG: transcription termination/antitermination factor NusG [Spirochaetota bacterium]|nr:MAG: transcription termination/antitermination factor NusG [Spirochaetota bacterium]
MPKNWYVLHTYSGYENKVEKGIKSLIEKKELGDVIFQVKVPSEEVAEIRSGKKRVAKKKYFPGYILIEMNIPEDSEYEWNKMLSLITKIPGVTGFVGSGRNKKPVPLSSEDVKNILQRMGEIKGEKTTIPKFLYTVGETVKVVDGPFKSFTGTVEDINDEKGKIKVRVEIFGRSTPVELDFLQVEKI